MNPDLEHASNEAVEAVAYRRPTYAYGLLPTEHDRWWQAFCANLAHATALWTEDSPAAKRAADIADAAVAEAKKRGRL